MPALNSFCASQGDCFNHFSSSQVKSSIKIHLFGPLLQIDNDGVITVMLQKHILEDHWRKVPLLHFRICSNFYIYLFVYF